MNSLILSTDSGIGKTSSLIKCLYNFRNLYPCIKGYTTQRIFKYENPYGFINIDINDAIKMYAKTLNPKVVLCDNWKKTHDKSLFLKLNKFGNELNYEIFTSNFFKFLHNFKSSDLIVIDEIGGKELLNDDVFNLLKKIITSDIKTIIVYKNTKQFNSMFLNSNSIPNSSLLNRRMELEQLFGTFVSLNSKDDIEHLLYKYLRSNI